jgi:NADH:ubiquinone oxidoreductase subunit F (NADH-binding)
MAASSAGQCGPCVFGLRAIAEATGRLAAGMAARDDLERLQRWCVELPGRGACHHPDGAATLMQSALWTFGQEFAIHQREGRCSHPTSGREAA